jgi:uncharacterized protein (TIGR02996 family)
MIDPIAQRTGAFDPEGPLSPRFLDIGWRGLMTEFLPVLDGSLTASKQSSSTFATLAFHGHIRGNRHVESETISRDEAHQAAFDQYDPRSAFVELVRQKLDGIRRCLAGAAASRFPVTGGSAGFLAGIIADQADSLRRLVYADWLEERGEVMHAELIRLSNELIRLSAAGLGALADKNRKFVALEARSGEVTADLLTGPLFEPLLRGGLIAQPGFGAGGLLWKVEGQYPQVADFAAALSERHPIQVVTFQTWPEANSEGDLSGLEEHAAVIDALNRCPWLIRVMLPQEAQTSLVRRQRGPGALDTFELADHLPGVRLMLGPQSINPRRRRRQ